MLSSENIILVLLAFVVVVFAVDAFFWETPYRFFQKSSEDCLEERPRRCRPFMKFYDIEFVSDAY